MKYPINYTADGYGCGWAETAEEAIAEYIAESARCGDYAALRHRYTASLGTVQVFNGRGRDFIVVISRLKRDGLETTCSSAWGCGYTVEVTTWKVVPV